MHLTLSSLRRIAYWLLPPVILLLIFREIDVSELHRNLDKTDPWLLLLGIFAYPISTLFGALRWKVLLTPYNRVVIPLFYAARHYWISLATGYFTPGSIGMDIYRVVIVGRSYGNYILNMTIVLIEKFMALFSCMGLIILLYPLIAPLSSATMITDILNFAYVLFILVIVIAAIIALLHHNEWLQRIAVSAEQFVMQKLRASAIRLGFSSGQETTRIPFREMIEPVTKPHRLLLLIVLSLAIQICSAIGIQILFAAVGYELDFVINLFLGPIFFLIFLMPVSFAGIGVREAAFIVLYGLFGVPKETALLVSFYSMIGGLLTTSIGAAFIYFTKSTSGEVESP